METVTHSSDFEILVKFAVISFSAMSAVIGLLWSTLLSKSKKCDNQHEDSTREIIKLSVRVGELDGEVRGVTSLSEAVLKEIRNSIIEKNSR